MDIVSHHLCPLGLLDPRNHVWRDKILGLGQRYDQNDLPKELIMNYHSGQRIEMFGLVFARQSV